MKRKIILPVIIGIFIFANVFMTIIAGAEGTKLGDIEKKLATLKEDKRKSGIELVEASSLKNIKAGVNELGFAEPTRIVYLLEEGSLAKLPDSF